MNTRLLDLRQHSIGKNDARYYAINYKNTGTFNVFFCDGFIGKAASIEEAEKLADGHYNSWMGEYYE